MSNKQLGMEKIRQVLRCYSQGYGGKSTQSSPLNSEQFDPC